MPKTFDFVSIQAPEHLRQDVNWTGIFVENTVFIAILAPNGFRKGHKEKKLKFRSPYGVTGKSFLVIFKDFH